MAENSVIISAEEEAKLLKPIDEYVEKIQKKIDMLRVDGSDKVNDLKNQIAIAKENKNLSKVQRDKIIANSKKELESAKRVEAANKEEIKKLIAEAEDYLAKHYKKDYYDVVNNSCKAAKAEENNRYEKIKADLITGDPLSKRFSWLQLNLPAQVHNTDSGNPVFIKLYFTGFLCHQFAVFSQTYAGHSPDSFQLF